jgi:hypothetical protein
MKPEVLLLLLYFGIFFPVSITQLSDSEFWKYDPRSIMSALDGLTTSPLYNMNSQYHSKFYGWTFFSINFVAISLLKLIGMASEVNINFIVKEIQVIVGGLVVLASYRLSARFMSSAASAITVFLLMIDPVFTHYVLTIHPEMMGLLFQLLGIWSLCLVWNQDQFSRSQFTLAAAMLCLSALCKQPFAICAFFIFLGFVLVFLQSKSQRAILAKNIVSIVLISSFVSVFTLFVIHPYALLDPLTFIQTQKDLLASQAPPFSAAVALEWLVEASRTLVVPLNFLLLAFALPIRSIPFPFKLSLVFTVLCVIIFIFGQRVFLWSTYLFPAYGFMYFNVAYSVHLLCKRYPTFIGSAKQSLFIVFSTSVVGSVAASNLVYTITTVQVGYLFDGRSTLNRTWDHLSKLPSGTRVAFSPNIPILDPLKSTSCSAWVSCGSVKDIEAFNPQVVVFSPVPHYNYEAFKEFVSIHQFKLVNRITSENNERPECSSTAKRLVVKDLSNLGPALYQAYVGSMLDCFSEYSAALKSHSTGSISTGPDVFIYQKASGF